MPDPVSNRLRYMIHYTPIACSLHESLALAILAGRRLRVRLHRDSPHSPGGPLPPQPSDLSIAEAAEWLDARDDQGQSLRLRLDWIVDAQPCT